MGVRGHLSRALKGVREQAVQPSQHVSRPEVGAWRTLVGPGG